MSFGHDVVRLGRCLATSRSPSTGDGLWSIDLVNQKIRRRGRRPTKHARTRAGPGRATDAIGANGAVTKTPLFLLLQNPANPGLPDPAPAVLKDTRENHIGTGSGHRMRPEQIVGFPA